MDMDEQGFTESNERINSNGIDGCGPAIRDEEQEWTDKKPDIEGATNNKVTFAVKAVISSLIGFLKRHKSDNLGERDNANNGADKKTKILFYLAQKAEKKAERTVLSTARKLKKTYSHCRRFSIDRIKKSRGISIIFGGSVIILLLISIIITVIHVYSKPHKPNVFNNLLRINTIQSEINELQTQLTEASRLDDGQKITVERKLHEIDNKLNKVSQGSGVNQKKQIEALRATIQSENISIYKKVDALKNEVKQLKHKVTPAPSLSPKALPFVVQDIDTWNGKPYAQIVQKSNETMVGYIGLYQRAGLWKVIEINAPEQTVTLVNKEGQVVHVQVEPF